MTDSALPAIRAAVELRPDQAEFRVNPGNAYAMSGMPDSAARHFWIAVELKPELTQADENLKKLYRWTGKPDSATLVRRLLEKRFHVP